VAKCVDVYLQLHFDKCTHSDVISPIVVIHKIYKQCNAIQIITLDDF